MKKNSMRFISILLALCVVIMGGLILYSQLGHLNEPSSEPATPEIPPPVEVAEEPESDPVIMRRFLELHGQNNDLVGWIRVPNTPIDYPVVYCSDNEFYLKHDFSGKPSSDGVPFLDKGAGILENNQSLSIYGHYLTNGTMFTALHKYKNLEYYRSYPLFEFDTLYEEGFYKIFAVFYMAGNSSDGLFYYYPVSNFKSDEAFMRHVDQILARSIFKTPVDVVPGDQLVLMTCCTYETNNLRLIVAGRKIRPGETFAAGAENAYLNPEPLYPQKWYAAKGGTPPPLPEQAPQVSTPSDSTSQDLLDSPSQELDDLTSDIVLI